MSSNWHWRRRLMSGACGSTSARCWTRLNNRACVIKTRVPPSTCRAHGRACRSPPGSSGPPCLRPCPRRPRWRCPATRVSTGSPWSYGSRSGQRSRAIPDEVSLPLRAVRATLALKSALYYLRFLLMIGFSCRNDQSLAPGPNFGGPLQLPAMACLDRCCLRADLVGRSRFCWLNKAIDLFLISGLTFCYLLDMLIACVVRIFC